MAISRGRLRSSSPLRSGCQKRSGARGSSATPKNRRSFPILLFSPDRAWRRHAQFGEKHKEDKMERIIVAILTIFTLDRIGAHFDRLCHDEVRYCDGPER